MSQMVKEQEIEGLQSNVIQGFLKLKKISQRSLAREGGVTGEAISQVISRVIVSRRLQEIIAKRLGLPYEFVWGSDKKAA